ncbi:MAG TPA: hypothetical protein VEH04_17040 [Verrucomicrobiae bacterium]|nr:hypothetical protein [Verrucomicrobiae bacterium]
MHPVETIIAAEIARTLFVTAYADAVESGELDAPGASGGADWMDVAPATPDNALAHAWRLIGRIEQCNRTSLACILAAACRADGVSFEKLLEDVELPDTARPRYTYLSQFGHYLAMQSLGHGVSWFDDHEEFDLKLPYIENPLDDEVYDLFSKAG